MPTSAITAILYSPIRLLAVLWDALIGRIPYAARREHLNNERAFKARMLKRVAEAYTLRTFIETGTHTGDTTADLAPTVDTVITIEIDPDLHAAANQRFASQPHVTCILGDSADKLREITPRLVKQALFWLDGHYSGAGTGGEGTAAPLGAELQAIAQSPRNDHIIVIDDISDFCQPCGNEPLSDVLAHLEGINPNYRFYFDFDMLFALPYEANHRDFWRNIAVPTYVR